MEKKYTNGEITVYWKPDICIHSAKCFRSLISVFDPRRKPWINMQGAPTEEIIKTVNACPSTALSFAYNDQLEKIDEKVKQEDSPRLKIMSKGPIMVEGECVVIDKDGNEILKSGRFFLCRCGASKNKPFCDSSHKAIGFSD